MPDTPQVQVEDSHAVKHRILPGQLWRWAFVIDDTWWTFPRVTTARTSTDVSFEIVRNGDIFMVMVVDDPGPYCMPEFREDGTITPTNGDRWHVVLFRSTLCWMQHSWFEESELVNDVP